MRRTWNVLVASEWRSHDISVRESNLVPWAGREETLEECDGTVEHDRALTAGLRADSDLLGVGDVARNVRNVRGRAWGEVRGAQLGAQEVEVALWTGKVSPAESSRRARTTPSAVESVSDGA